MIVKNIAVSDRKFFTEWLVRDLIQHQISYVQIENEFHFFAPMGANSVRLL